jgi:hypothetical protein
MDAIDKKILAELQSDGRLTLTDLADRVGLSMSPATAGFGPWSSPESSLAITPSSTPSRSG